MNNRISSGMMFTQSVALMMAKQNKMHHLEQQIATGSRLVSAKDDPVAAGSAVGLDRALAELDRLEKNASNVQNRLGLQENALTQVGDMMGRITELAIYANNPALADADKKAMVTELEAIRGNLLATANATDGTGRYLFGGTTDANTPFQQIAGGVRYVGDQTQRSVEVAPDSYAADALPGSEIFLRIPTGDGVVDGRAASTNTGKGVLTDVGRDSSATWDGNSYTVRFTAGNAYEVVDDTDTVIASGSFTSGQDIVFNGVRMQISGVPNAGDSFALTPSTSRDVFATVDNMIAALSMDTTTEADSAAQQNLLQAGIRDVARAAERMIDSRASGGAQLKIIDNAAESREANTVTLKTTLSGMRDLDYADALSQYQLESTALQAAQTLFTRMQQNSLFNIIR